jgi:SH3-like domain-containing protein
MTGFFSILRPAAAALLVLILLTAETAAQNALGPVTRLPLPRFASLKSDRVNLREGPSKDHRTRWVYQRAGLPVEIIGEFETWRRIRDAEGGEGWVLQSLLSGRRTALVAPWWKEKTLPLRETPNDGSEVVARLEIGVQASIRACDGQWCRLQGKGFDGYLQQNRVWGAYPAETVR